MNKKDNYLSLQGYKEPGYEDVIKKEIMRIVSCFQDRNIIHSSCFYAIFLLYIMKSE